MCETKNENYQKMVKAFQDVSFQKKISQYRYEIEVQLKSFIEWLDAALKPSQKIFHSPESRIKSKMSFEEKIYRKDYINKWSLSGNNKDIQNEILHGLPDLIGFRITCFFMDDEEVIYQKLKEYYDDLKKFSDIVLDFSEGTVQKNGKRIYKVSGKYKKEVSFELQIKAATHNVWGEVEHKTIYKGRQFSINLQERQTITEGIFNILQASDQQLLALFKNSYTQKDLVCGLFAEQTKDKVKSTAKTDYLAGHYTSFFSIFLSAVENDIYQYVAAVLSNKTMHYKKHIPDLGVSNDTDKKIVQRIKDVFLQYYLDVQYCIAQELYDFRDFDEFLLFMVKTIGTRFMQDENEDAIEEDVFAESDSSEVKNEEYDKLILNVLEVKLPDARKKGV